MVSQKTEGFTLLETLMVVFLLGLILIVGGNLFFSVLKGASKAEVMREGKQAGDYAMNVMARTIRNAQNIADCSTANGITITNPDRTVTNFSCISEDGVNKIASGGGRLTGKNVTLGNPCTLLFICDTTISPPKVKINFTLSQKSTTGQRVEEQAQVSFQQTVSLMTY